MTTILNGHFCFTATLPLNPFSGAISCLRLEIKREVTTFVNGTVVFLRVEQSNKKFKNTFEGTFSR